VEGCGGGVGPPEFRMGILQGDFNDANIIVDDTGNNVVGVIDFCDTTYSWRVLDISIAMAYASLSTYGKTSHSLSAAAAILRGFHSVYPLTPTERLHLRLLVAARLACSVTLGAYSHMKNPENAYLLLHAEPAWKALELFWGEGGIGGEIECLLDVACSVRPFHVDGVVRRGDNERVEEYTSVIDCTDISFPDPNVIDVFRAVRRTAGTETPTTSDAGAAAMDPPSKETGRITNSGVDGLADVHLNPTITFVTKNKKTFEEARRILSPSASATSLPFAIDHRTINLPDLQGNPLRTARETCSIAARRMDGPVVTETTSLHFDTPDETPGPYLRWSPIEPSCGRHDDGRLDDVVRLSEDRSASARTVVGFCPGAGEEVVVFDGRTEGRIVPPRGGRDVGGGCWDAIFEPEGQRGAGGLELTYAEMTEEGREGISSRSRAFRKLRDYLVVEAVTIKETLGR